MAFIRSIIRMRNRTNLIGLWCRRIQPSIKPHPHASRHNPQMITTRSNGEIGLGAAFPCFLFSHEQASRRFDAQHLTLFFTHYFACTCQKWKHQVCESSYTSSAKLYTISLSRIADSNKGEVRRDALYFNQPNREHQYQFQKIIRV